MYQLDSLAVGDGTTVGAAAQDAWRDWCRAAHGRFDFAFDTDVYRARLVRQHTPTYQLIGWTGDTELVTRRARDVRRDPRGHYELLVPLRGSLNVGPDGAVRQLEPGEMALVPFDVPFQCGQGADAAALTLLVPAERVEGRLGSRAIRGHRVFGSKGLARASRDLVVSLLRERAHLSGADFDAGCDRVVDLFCLARDGATAEPSAGGTVLDAVRRHIREHATDPELSVSAIATAVGWSTRYVQTVLARAGTTPTELIRRERLDLARTRLSNPTLAGQTIAAVAASVGFASPSAFSHAYREHFGCSPRETRKDAASSG
ncbi:AraC family transcriptional regulator [Amycolatopsis echigonensis]|uniref:AraC family transcriptional regulator n=1 Tax=Amycolatopsis echigonensis TaxID=2576905 RepID=A0A2N3X1M2_9PSEU|nr:AraC family transcriptional regulator [Amycolatopsis niigatensis]PKW00028.1 AraC family transcriptional regulator [Amycolatopsis niigatensis]